MVKLIRFSRDIDSNAWFAEIPEWEGDRAELEMIIGADVLLDILAQGEESISIRMTDESQFQGTSRGFTLKFLRKEAGGAFYQITDSHLDFEIWLCHVTEFVFDYLPKNIYCKY